MNCSSLIRISFLNNDICFDKYIDFDDYEIDKANIIKTPYSYIYKAIQKTTRKPFAFKIFPMQYIKKISDFFDLIDTYPNLEGVLQIRGYHLPLTRKSFSILKQNEIIDSTKSYDVYLDNYIIVTDFMSNGTLEMNIDKYFSSSNKLETKINPTIRCKIIFGVAETMRKLHMKNILNIDLRSHNILLDNNFEPKINLFSIAKLNKDESILNHPYLAPEVIDNCGGDYDFPADIYSFAFFLYRMFSPLDLHKICSSNKF